MRCPVFAVLVQGPSMAPTLRAGDALLVRRTGRARPGQVVVVRFPGEAGLFVKRAQRHVAGGWWVVGDNPYGSDDSARYGPGEVVGRVLLRYWPRLSWVGSRRPGEVGSRRPGEVGSRRPTPGDQA